MRLCLCGLWLGSSRSCRWQFISLFQLCFVQARKSLVGRAWSRSIIVRIRSSPLALGQSTPLTKMQIHQNNNVRKRLAARQVGLLVVGGIPSPHAMRSKEEGTVIQVCVCFFQNLVNIIQVLGVCVLARAGLLLLSPLTTTTTTTHSNCTSHRSTRPYFRGGRRRGGGRVFELGERGDEEALLLLELSLQKRVQMGRPSFTSLHLTGPSTKPRHPRISILYHRLTWSSSLSAWKCER